MRFLLSILLILFFFNTVSSGQSKAELEDIRIKTLEEISYVDNLLQTTTKEKSESMNAVKIIGTKVESERGLFYGNEAGNITFSERIS